jgi:hypothetical protein
MRRPPERLINPVQILSQPGCPMVRWSLFAMLLAGCAHQSPPPVSARVLILQKCAAVCAPGAVVAAAITAAREMERLECLCADPPSRAQPSSSPGT